jgi:hypothetical protein
MKNMLITILVLSCLLLSQYAFAEQKTIFCGDSYKYGTFKEDCVKKCAEFNCKIDEFTENGWIIKSYSPKEIVKQDWEFKFAKYQYGCTCVGTQYVLIKSEPSKSEPNNISNTDNKKIELLEKEIELLKKEFEIQKQEIESLKAKMK